MLTVNDIENTPANVLAYIKAATNNLAEAQTALQAAGAEVFNLVKGVSIAYENIHAFARSTENLWTVTMLTAGPISRNKMQFTSPESYSTEEFDTAVRNYALKHNIYYFDNRAPE